MTGLSKTSSKLLLLSCTCLALGACGATPKNGPGLDRTAQIDSALARAAKQGGGSSQSLIALESAYKHNPDNVNAAVNYGRALREAEYFNRAGIVLSPLANNEKGPSAAKAEYAAVQLAQGNYVSAEKFAQQAVLKDDKNFEAYHFLGIALDAQGMHKEAERAFRKALEYWEGDPTPIINNLALNLTAQEYLDEAIELLEKAMAVSPGRTELERNHRIISALRQTKLDTQGSRPAPKPRSKPEQAPKPQAAAPAPATGNKEEVTTLEPNKAEAKEPPSAAPAAEPAEKKQAAPVAPVEKEENTQTLKEAREQESAKQAPKSENKQPAMKPAKSELALEKQTKPAESTEKKAQTAAEKQPASGEAKKPEGSTASGAN